MMNIKNIFMLVLISLITLITCFPLSAEEQTAEEIINNVKTNLDKIEKFEAEFKLEIQLAGLKVPNKTGKIYFQKPDSTRFEIEGFSMMPKQGVGNYLSKIFQSNATNLLSGESEINGKQTYIIKIIPNSNESQIVISTLWINKLNYNVLKAEITSKNNGTFDIESEYMKTSEGLFVQSKSIISFQVPKFKIPKAFTGDTRKRKTEKDPNSTSTKGKVIIEYYNYKVN